MKRHLFFPALAGLAAVFCWFGCAWAEADFLTRTDIIEQLDGVSATREFPTAATRGWGEARIKEDRGVRIEQKANAVAVVPKYVVTRLLFKIDSTELADEKSRLQLSELGNALSSDELKNITVEIAGHTCDLGSAGHNQWLSQRRAERIREYLVSLYGISPDRLLARGYGEALPNVPNTSEENRRLNRRVIIQRIE